MIRSIAVQRIRDGLGFRAADATFDDKIVLRLQEAQRDLEAGKTIPPFLLQEGQILTLALGDHSTPLPTGFMRESDEAELHYTPAPTDAPVFLSRRYYQDAVIANLLANASTGAPKIYVVRKSTIEFITTSNATYTLYWDYYKHATLLTSDIENEWLATPAAGGMGAPEWLIGEAGLKIALDVRDKEAQNIFSTLRQQGRAACFGESIADESSGGPIQMGANL